jgi:hypothetical protein
MMRTWGALVVVVAAALAVAAACGDELGRGRVSVETGGVDPSPADAWLRCACRGCSARGAAAPDELVGGCVRGACPADADAVCVLICARYGLSSCAVVSGACQARACQQCATSSVCLGGARCFAAGQVCGRPCTSAASDCACEECMAQALGGSVCVPPRTGATCGVVR